MNDPNVKELPGSPSAAAEDFDARLARFRSQIDAIDDQIIALLKTRSGIVQQVGQLKHSNAPGRCPVRPGREATQVRRIAEAFRGSPFEPAAAAAMWRMMIMASLKLEGEIRVSVCAGEEQKELPWIAREYFAPFSTYLKQLNSKRVIGDLLDGKAQIGVVPPPSPQDTAQTRWWTDLLGSASEDKPKIFARLPFIRTQKSSEDRPLALAVARVTPEETGDDLSYLAIDADEMASQHKLQLAFGQAGLEVRWIDVLASVPGKRIHLVEVKGFVTPESERYLGLLAGLGNAVRNTTFLGAVAAPLVIPG